eukprot:2742678-Pleurochrysis_carterae.AAC.1
MAAEETLMALLEHVFTKYSFPLVIKSDNGTAFRNELMACFSKYVGFRNAYVLLYNAQANGMAEQIVGRITRLFGLGTHSSSRIGHRRYQWLRSH